MELALRLRPDDALFVADVESKGKLDL